MTTINVGIYLFDGVEVLDFAGPFEVFSTASRVSARTSSIGKPTFSVFTIAENTATFVSSRAELKVIPDHSISDHPPIDVLIIPGGKVDAECEKEALIQWVSQQAGHTQIVASVCTGAFILGKAGLLDSLKATTHWEDLSSLQTAVPNTQVIPNVSWIDEGNIVTSAGISAGIDMSLHLVERLYNAELARATAKQMQYHWNNRAEPTHVHC